MKKFFILLFVLVFFVSLLTYNSTVMGVNKGDYYYTSLPYTPLAAKTNYTIYYVYDTSVGTSSKSYDYVYIQAGLEDVDLNSGLHIGFDRPSLMPVGWVIFASHTPLIDNDFYTLDDFDVFTFRGGTIEGGILSADNLVDVADEDFSKPFSSGGVFYSNNTIYYPRLDGISFIEECTLRIEALDQPVFPSKGSGIVEYFVYVVDEIVYLVSCIDAIVSAFGSIF